MRDIRIAAVVFNAPVARIQHNLDRMFIWIRAARQKGADVVCFPELSVSGYSNHDTIRSIAQSIPGPVSRQLSQWSVDQKLLILAGMVESGKDGALFASHLVASPDGKLAVYRKLHLAPPETNLYTAGDRVPVFDCNGLRFGVQLCYDAHFPELSTRMTEKGVELIFLPHASPRGDAASKHLSWMRHLPARAFDNGVFVVACNQCGDNRMGLNFPGNAVIIGPSGDVIAKDVSGEEGLLMADLRSDDLEHVRGHRMRHFFPNRRPELYRRG
jgi:N-carbamoylputrescine amidase